MPSPPIQAPLLLLALGLGACAPPTDALARGQQLFTGCGTCHGTDGLGNAAIQVPAIAGLPDWYLKTTIHKFRTGARGAHPDDHEGLRMRPMSRMLRTDDDIAAVSAYVAKMPAGARTRHVEGGDATAGQATFALCATCHGQDGMGIETMKGPPIALLEDWYLVAQLGKFKSGIRGTNPADAEGAQMRPMAMTLADDQAVKNVVAYIQTLKK